MQSTSIEVAGLTIMGEAISGDRVRVSVRGYRDWCDDARLSTDRNRQNIARNICRITKHNNPDDLLRIADALGTFNRLRYEANGGAGHDVRDERAIARAWLDSMVPHKIIAQEWYRWTGTHYAVMQREDMLSQLGEFVDASTFCNSDGDCRPTIRQMGDWLRQAETFADLHVPSTVELPAWHPVQECDVPARQLMSYRNGLLDIDAWIAGYATLIPHDPRLVTLASCPYDFDPHATCPVWMEKLHAEWGENEDMIDTLAEFMGYSKTCDVSQDKGALIIGPSRGMKGIIGWVYREVLGRQNVEALDLNQQIKDIVWAKAKGKLAYIADEPDGADGSKNVGALIKQVLGQSPIVQRRQYRDPETLHEHTIRLMVLCNNFPTIRESSTALANRFLVFPITNSYLGREDTRLRDKLRCELPGIDAWAMAGLRRLHERGRFMQTTLGAERLRELEDQLSWAAAFARHCLEKVDGEFEDSYRMLADDMFDAYLGWHDWMRYPHKPHDRHTFHRELRSALPTLRVDTGRPRRVTGYRLSEDGQEMLVKWRAKGYGV